MTGAAASAAGALRAPRSRPTPTISATAPADTADRAPPATAPEGRRRSASSSPTASGSSSSATSSCSRPSSRATLCCGRARLTAPKSAEIFDLTNVAIETALLLLSSFTCGMAALALGARRMLLFQAAMAVTFLLGATFVALELVEFYGLVERGAGPSRSAFLSAFFTLVGCHGLHVSVGLLWLLTMMAQVLTKGFRADIVRRTLCFALFWHALDIFWVGVFSIVYLMGAVV